MPKLCEARNDDGSHVVQIFFCPGCKDLHQVTTRGGPIVWEWNGSADAPTFSPSLLCNPHDPTIRCHSFVREGKIEFLGDCFHDLKGQTVEIPEWDGWP